MRPHKVSYKVSYNYVKSWIYKIRTYYRPSLNCDTDIEAFSLHPFADHSIADY